LCLFVDARFTRRINTPLPGPEARQHILQKEVGTTANDLTDEDYVVLAGMTEG
jgi:vacuolar protein-sorting-associated protein 4